MGMAASQLRFLALTARKTNCEFEGQQVNQQRTSLANRSAGSFNQLVKLTPPTPPSNVLNYNNVDLDKDAYGLYNDYKLLANTLGDADGTLELNKSALLSEEDFDAIKTAGGFSNYEDYKAYETSVKSRLGSLGITDMENIKNYKEIDIAQQIYDKAKIDYDKKVADINSEISSIQQMDKTLELELRQLDTEQEAMQTEMESVKKVIDKNIESLYKTFA